MIVAGHCFSGLGVVAYIDADSGVKAIARRMVVKCRGAPLATKALGNLLKSSTLDWKKTELSGIWKLEHDNGILRYDLLMHAKFLRALILVDAGPTRVA